MKVGEFDFGAEDARYLRLRSPEQKTRFVDSFVIPKSFKIDDFFLGDKFFIYGPKGSGKTALLQYIKLKAEKEKNATTGFYYFQSAFSEEELKLFLQKKRTNEVVVDDTVPVSVDEGRIFWRIFILMQVAKFLNQAGVTEGPVSEFIRLIEAAKLISKGHNIVSKYPALQKFSVTLSRDPKINFEGTFENATPADLNTYIELAENSLDQVYIRQCPLFLFIDEMETYVKGDSSDELRLSAIASLVRAVRDFNERYRDSDIRVIAAIRDAVVNEVSVVQGEVYRIIRDNGVELDWSSAIDSLDFHPLEKMALNRIATQDPDLSPYTIPIPKEILRHSREKYFSEQFSLRLCLNLTWFRPRDMALLLEEARKIDAEQKHFQFNTLKYRILKPLGKRMWQDALSGLAIKYKPVEMNGIDRILRGGPAIYSRDQFLLRLDELSEQYDDVAFLSDNKWMEVIEDLYKVGVLYVVSTENNHKNFSFRGDPMPSISAQFDVGIHQILTKELALT